VLNIKEWTLIRGIHSSLRKTVDGTESILRWRLGKGLKSLLFLRLFLPVRVHKRQGSATRYLLNHAKLTAVRILFEGLWSVQGYIRPWAWKGR